MCETISCKVLTNSVNAFFGVVVALNLASCSALAADPSYYVKKSSWQETMRASVEALMKLEQAGELGVSLPDLGASDFTVTAWIKTESEGGTILAKAPARGGWVPGGKVFFLQGGTPTFDVGWVGAVETRIQVNDGKWHHLALAKADELEFYVDGRLVGGDTLELGPDVSDHVLRIGYCTGDFPEQSGFEGEIDEVRIYSRRLSASEVKNICDNKTDVSKGLAGWWKFEAGAADSSGSMNHGRIVGTRSVDGKSGKALRFSGRSLVVLPASRAAAMRNEIRSLIARDFTVDRDRQQIEWEQQDKIWDEPWEAGDLMALGRRYIELCRDICQLRTKAEQLASNIKTTEDLGKIRALYHLSRRADEIYAGVGGKISAMEKEIDYLQENYSKADAKWAKYVEQVNDLSGACGRALAKLIGGDSTAIEQLSKLEVQLEEVHNSIPLRLPSGPAGPGRFGAYYTRLKYSLEWDRKWRIGPDADVVVRFDEFGHRFVFWRGTSYIPCWVSDAGGWYTNEFFERRGGERSGTMSMVEPMSDKQARYSHVRILESNDARVVLHWRYAPVDLKYNLAYIDKQSGWGDWVDEYYTIYPDAVGVREATLYTSAPGDWIEYQESIVINQPGTRPEDNMHYAAVTLVNMEGRSSTYSWEHTWPEEFDKPENGNIQIVNLKGRTRPFSIVDPDGASVRAYPKYGAKTKFHCWNHWPVAQEKSDTTVATTFDKPSHTSLSHITWKPYAQEENSRTWIMLHGMTDGKAAELAKLAKSWLSAPKLKLKGTSEYTNEGYDPTERAYVLSCNRAGERSTLEFVLDASADSPIVNPAFVVKSWGMIGTQLKLDGKTIERGKLFRYGHRPAEHGDDLIVWIKAESDRPTNVSLLPAVARPSWPCFHGLEARATDSDT